MTRCFNVKVRTSALFIMMTVILILTGCGGDKAGSGNSGSDGKVEIVFWNPDGATWQPTWEKLVDMFEDKHPDISVNLVNIPGGGYDEKLNTAFAANQGPDVWINWYAHDHYDMGHIAPLNSFIEKDNWDMNKYFQPIVDASLKGANGQYYGLPRDMNMVTMLYNKDLFDKYGVPYPEDNWTFYEYRETAKKLTHSDDGIYGTDLPTGDYKFITGAPIIWNWTGGKDLASSDGWTVEGYMDNPDLIDLFKAAQDMIRDGSVAPPDVLETMTGQYGIFTSGKVAMVPGYLWGMNVLQEVDFEWGAVTFPGAPDGTQTYARNEPVNFYMNNDSKNKEAAWEFMKFMSGEEVSKEMINDFTWAPPIKQAWIDAGLDEDPVLGVFFREGSKETFNPVYLRHSKWWEAQSSYADAVNKMLIPLRGEEMADPAVILPEVTREVQQRLDTLKSEN